MATSDTQPAAAEPTSTYIDAHIAEIEAKLAAAADLALQNQRRAAAEKARSERLFVVTHLAAAFIHRNGVGCFGLSDLDVRGLVISADKLIASIDATAEQPQVPQDLPQAARAAGAI